MDFLRWVLLNVQKSKISRSMAPWKAKKGLSEEETLALYLYLVENPVNGKLRRGAVNDAAEEFGVTRRTVSSIRAESHDAEGRANVVKNLKTNY